MRRPTTFLATLLGTFLLSSSTFFVQAAHPTGFCGDCQTFASAISVCGGTFGPSDIEISGTYVLQQAYAKCTCTAFMQQVIWDCAKCELLAGFDSHAQPPTAYHTQCIGWGITNDQWTAVYTGPIGPGAVNTGGGNNPTASVSPSTTASSGNNGGTNTGGSGSNPTNGGNGNNNNNNTSGSGSLNGTDGDTTESSGPNGTAIGVSVGIISVAVVAGIFTIIMIRKRHRRRHDPIMDLNPPAISPYKTLDDEPQQISSGRWSDQKVGGGGGDYGYNNSNNQDIVAASRMPHSNAPFQSRPNIPVAAYNNGGYDQAYEMSGGYDYNQQGGYTGQQQQYEGYEYGDDGSVGASQMGQYRGGYEDNHHGGSQVGYPAYGNGNNYEAHPTSRGPGGSVVNGGYL